ncbi:SusD/RagB family nutrient-binding outer membrane lipoprotein [Halosquirtibacter xylanolyticus]|uniref:SusD/RagB family nutrient-binding outer membrane lipoprotein n=1 Tax=Halosquirtibacter xylanolyticus TaxID=3374599 RepID=UPI003749695E|nr:SusD/RagB family nutrient-binding outer membrane lipoprotein [Prolixibacteraceae bacterium]
MMKNNILKICVALIILSGCTSDFDSLNTDPTKVTELDSKYLFTTVEKRGGFSNWGIYQLMQSLYVNQYAQYWANTTSYFPSDRYTMNNGWIEGVWNEFYSEHFRVLNQIVENPNENINRVQIARIYRAFLYQRWTDTWGAIPYSEASRGISKPKYDSQESIYRDLVNELQDAISKLDSSQEAGGFGSADVIYQGATDKWKRFANSLLLRIAIHMSNVDTEFAQDVATKAIASGVMSANSDAAILPSDPNNREATNPIHEIAYWNEFRMSKTMEVYMNGDKLGVVDPRLKMYWAPIAKRNNVVDEYDEINFKGVQNGLAVSNIPLDNLGGYSNVGPIASKYNYDAENQTYQAVDAGKALPMFIFSYAEVCFLKAEAGLRWGLGGDVKTNYDQGIRASMLQWSEEESNTYSGPVPSSQEISNYITEVGGTIDQKKISTQKWLALFPDGFEGWTEFRRTGYPDFIPVPSPDPSAGLNGEFISRIAYPQVEKNLNPNEYNKSATLGDSMWWQK